MSNILKVTTPLAGYEAQNQVKNPTNRPLDPSVQSPVAPDKVVKPDARNDALGQETDAALKFRYETNYGNFMSQINNLNGMTDEFAKLFFEKFATLAQSGLQDGYSGKIAEYLNMVSMSGEDLTAFLKDQTSLSVKLTGAFFEVLKQVMDNTNSVELKTGILDFLRRYVDMAENTHTMNNIHNILGNLRFALIPSQRENFDKLLAQLINVSENGDGALKNSQLLKNSILPFLNSYITKMNDRGFLRENSALLGNYIAKLENGLPSRVQEAFESLLKFQGMQAAFKNFDPAVLMQVLENTDFMKAKRKQKWADGLTEVIKEGMNSSQEEKAVFQSLMQAVLLNESVYMPVIHTMLPLNIDGKLMFAQTWIDPDAQKDHKERGLGKMIQGLVKFDIEEMGFFDVFFIYQDGNMKMQISCPTALEQDIKKVREDIVKLISSYGITPVEMFVDTTQESIPVSAAFPKIFERKNSINVSI